MRTSVVISSYNRVHLIEATIDSAIGQTTQPDEIIIVDDGSSDQTVSLLRSRYGSSNSIRLIIIEKPNGGQGSALNLGFSHSTGDIVIFLDCDDLLRPDFIEVVSTSWSPGTSHVYTAYVNIDLYGQVQPDTYSFPTPPGGCQKLLSTLSAHGGFAHQPTSANAFSSAYLRQVLPMPEAAWRTHPDIYLCYLAPIYGEVVAIPGVHCEIRVHDNLGALQIDGKINPKRLARSCEVHLEGRRAVVQHLSARRLPTPRKQILDEAPFLRDAIVLSHIDPADSARIFRDENRWSLTVRLLKVIIRDPGMKPANRLLNFTWLLASLIKPTRFERSSRR